MHVRKNGKKNRYCAACVRAKQAKVPKETSRRYMLKSKYGMTPEVYDAMMSGQQGCCAICRLPITGRIHIDHDHATGRVRGILCYGCNVGLGFFNDSIVLMKGAIAYLAKNGKDDWNG
jgi:hypothetical protein